MSITSLGLGGLEKVSYVTFDLSYVKAKSLLKI